jgi:group II intron reverse transcriptase/maturase
MLDEILSKENMTRALKRVESNKGACGIDGMPVNKFRPFLNERWAFIKSELLDGTYKPSPVRKVEIPKPDGSKRMLGIPTVLDRLIQQAIAQKIDEIYDKGFSDNSFGFRPKRSAHQAVRRVQEYLNAGNKTVIEFDLEKFFDRVNHDRLMTTLARRITDKRLLKLIRKYLETGIMAEGIVKPRTEGTPQGSPLSPILSNIVLDELDKELEKRGHKFVRYADDLSIYVRSAKSSIRVKESITRFIERKLKLKVNQTKSKISRPMKSNLLGFSFYKDTNGWQARISQKSYLKFKQKVKELTLRNESISLEERITRLNKTIVGWVNYFKISKCLKNLKTMDKWIRFRIRMCVWKTWKKTRTRITNLVRLGLSRNEAYMYGNTRKGYCRIAHSPIMTRVMTNKYFKELGYTSLEGVYLKWQS